MKRSGYFREHSTSLQMTCTTIEKALVIELVALFRTSGLIRLKTECQNATCRRRASFYPQDRGVFTKEMEEVNLRLARECTLRKTSASPLAEKQIVGIYLNRQLNRDSQKKVNMNDSKELGNYLSFDGDYNTRYQQNFCDVDQLFCNWCRQHRKDVLTPDSEEEVKKFFANLRNLAELRN